MKIKTIELTGTALDRAVAKCAGIEWGPGFKPSTDPSLAYPIIFREKIALKYLGYDKPPYWGALKFQPSSYDRQGSIGETPLIAAMRCYVLSKLGEEVEIPSELL
jgi:hypothetical protein